MYIQSQGGGADISSFLGEKSLGVRRKLSSNIDKVKDKDLTPDHPFL
jgi:hypothetical protein